MVREAATAHPPRCGPGDERRGKTSRQGGVAVKERPRVQKPPKFKCVLHNDDYTTMEFVVFLLMTIFNKDEAEAVRIMLHVHNHGKGVAGVYTREIAETKAQRAIQLARANEFPLQVTVEEA